MVDGVHMVGEHFLVKTVPKLTAPLPMLLDGSLSPLWLQDSHDES